MVLPNLVHFHNDDSINVTFKYLKNNWILDYDERLE